MRSSVLLLAGACWLVSLDVHAAERLGGYDVDDEGRTVEHGAGFSFVDAFTSVISSSQRWEGSSTGGRFGFSRYDLTFSAGFGLAFQVRPMIEDALPEDYELDTGTVPVGGFWLELFFGYRAYRDGVLAASPGLIFMRADHSAYGTWLGVRVPVVLKVGPDSTFRLGADVSGYGAFGGYVAGTCSGDSSGSCVHGERYEEDLPTAVGFGASLFAGISFGGP